MQDIILSPKEAIKLITQGDHQCPHCGGKILSWEEKGIPSSDRELYDSWCLQTCHSCKGQCSISFGITHTGGLVVSSYRHCNLCELYE